MPRADWSFLESLLEEGQEYSTAIGRVWLTILFLLRMLVLGTAAESAWDDEQEDFVCNTKQPGCTSVCYDKAFPISHFRYFVLQVILVSTPTIFYFAYVAIKVKENDQKNKGKEENQADKGHSGRKTVKTVVECNDNSKSGKDKMEGDGEKCQKPKPKACSETPKLKGRLLGAYAFSILLKILLEAGFIVGLWFLYDGFFIAPKFVCTRSPCPHTVDCFVSRPTEKTIFTFYTQLIAAISLLLNLIELLHLLVLAISHRLEKRCRAQHQDFLPRFEQVPSRLRTAGLPVGASQANSTGSHISLPIQGEGEVQSDPCGSCTDMTVEMNWEPAEAGSDLLPSYANCIKPMRKPRQYRCHYKKHSPRNGQNQKSANRSPSEQKHYV
ncbi:gap junction alpha-4 protein [Oryzias latipes]|uniref:Gap junction protein n=1 Tax=Oryzias latipes TaxID=8090 RepID=A0A3B3HMV3_ORYLA|nr:gap junction alpha-4 protein [Oryzias latipes]